MASKEELLDSINPDMDLRQSFFEAVYAYNYTDPSFADLAIEKLEEAGCSKAREYYDKWVRNYEADREAMLERVSAWYSKWRCRSKENEGKNLWQKKLQTLTRPELRLLLIELLQDGTIEDPEEITALINQGQ